MFIFQDVFNNLFTIAEKVEIKGVIYDVFALAQDFTVAGGYVHRDLKLSCNNLKISSVVCDYMLDLGSFLVFMLIIWLLCLVLAPRFLEKTNDYVGKKTLNILGYGLLALITIPIACIILILLQLSSGFSFFLLTLYVLAIVLSKSLFTITANNYVCSKLKINKNTGIFGMLIASILPRKNKSDKADKKSDI